MKDSRTALKKGDTVNFSDGKRIWIKEEIGRGASCIVYDAAYLDDIGVQHNIRLKECYPNDLLIHRDSKGHLVPFENHQNKFETAKKNFTSAYRKNADIRNTLGLTNSTVNLTEISPYNNTIYIRMELNEGSDYGKFKDSSLKGLFTHVKSLAELIQKYHQNGYLYLDIKPENIFILPETEEHIILFDFDSVKTLEDLTNDNGIELSFSEGFSPPEQIQGKADKIGTHTDIYSIGALVFYKLFHRAATSQECKISSTYHFEEMEYASEKYQPKLYRTLDTFFKKTLSASIIPRWHDMQQVLEQLDELVQLSDVDGIYLIDSFQYDSACFVGRNEEIKAISDILAGNQLVFLSGIGGIGKTELAKQYANKYHDQYDAVLFSVFEENIETLVRDEIIINKINQDENESDKDYFERKMNLLKQIVTPKDLIIIDNFDVDSDEKLEILFRCPCKFIITTRMDFRDYNYKQIDVDRIGNLDDVLDLFYTYNNKDYSEEENDAVKKLIDYVDYHTMTVELMAKYLRNSEELPSCLYAKFLEKEGVTNTEEINVKQRKDLKLRSESVNSHLGILFDVSGFDDTEKEIIRSLSLLAGIRMDKSKFNALCTVEDGENKLELLVRNGWVEYNATSKKISLHQVIQDLIYKNLAPNASNCPCIVEGMKRYISSELPNETEDEIRYKVFGIFMERLSGDNLSYARLCFEYGKENRLEEAEQICLSYQEAEAFDILQKIYREKIRIISTSIPNSIPSETLKIPYSGREELASIGKLLDKVVSYCQKASEQPDYIVKEYIETGSEIDSLFANNLCSYSSERVPEMDKIYSKIVEMFDDATKKLPLTSYSAEEKENLYKKMQNFYVKENIGELYRSKYFSNPEKAYQYQELIDQLRKDTARDFAGDSTLKAALKRIDMDDITNSKVAETYEKEGKYEKAIEYYKRDFEKGNVKHGTTLWNIARLYFEMGNIDSGIACLERLIAYHREHHTYSCEVYTDLISGLIKQKAFDRVREYAKELIRYEKPNISPNEDSDSIEYILSAYYSLYLAEQSQGEKDTLWQKCLMYYKMLDNNEIREMIYHEYLYDFLVEYLDKENIIYETILKVLDRIEGFDSFFGSLKAGGEVREKIIQQSIKKYAGKKDFEKYHVILLVKLAELAKEDSYEDIKNGQKNCEEALKYYNIYGLQDKYIQSLIYRVKAELMLYDKDYGSEKATELKKLCDFKLLAERQLSDHNYSEEDQIAIWRNAAVQYSFTENYNMASVCLVQALEIIRPVLNQYEFSEFDGDYKVLMENLIEAYIEIGAVDSAYSTIIELYDKTVEYLVNIDNSDDMDEDSWEDNEEEDITDAPDDSDEDSWEDNEEADITDESEDMDEGTWEDDEDFDEDEDDPDLIYDEAAKEFLGYSDDKNDKIWWLEDIAKYFIEISKMEDAVRTYLAAMYLTLEEDVDTEMLKVGADVNKDILRLCKKIDELLEQGVTSNMIDSLVDYKDGILECEDLCPSSVEICKSITAKISERYQYQDVEFKRP